MTAKEFWIEFKTYEEDLRLKLILTKKEDYFRTFAYLCHQMETYCPGLAPKIVTPEEGESENFIFTISCAGNRDLLLYVNRLLDEAPKMEHWEIKALVNGIIQTDPKILSDPFKFEDFNITPKNIQFTIYGWYTEVHIFDILLLLPLNLSEIEHDLLDSAFLTIFEELWGECFVAEKINLFYYTHNASSNYLFLDLELLEVCLNSFE